MTTFLKLAIILILASFFDISCGNPITKTDFSQFAPLDPASKITLFWKFDEETITFQVHAATKGWAAIGFSPNGGMAGADIVMFWVDKSGKGYISDRFASGNGLPREDPQQDYNLLNASRNETHLIVSFTRKRNTCDSRDWSLTDGTTKVIYALNDELPQDKDTFQKHTIRGSKSLHLLDDKPLRNKELPEKDAISMEFRVSQVKVPDNKTTTYWCEIVRMPKFDQKMHVIRIDPLIEPQNVEIVHHIIVTMCSKDMSEFIGKGRPCSGEDTGTEATDFFACKQSLLAGWAVGGESTIYPDNMGLPLYGDAGFTYVMLEMHYENSEFKKGKVDSSGMRVWVTKNLRPIDLGQSIMGLNVNTDEQVIPPGVKEFTNYAYCTAECTAGFPKDGIRILGGFLHTHLAGRKIRVLHFRNGKQLPPLISDEYYDFNYQDTRRLNKPPVVLPGDEIVVECVYETLDRSKTTFSGPGTHDEMCLVFLEYYPAIYRAFGCVSVPNKRLVYEPLGLPFNETDPEDTSIPMSDGTKKDLAKYFREDFKDDWTPKKIEQLQKNYRDVEQTVACVRQDLKTPELNFTPNAEGKIEGLDLFPGKTYPKFSEPWIAPDLCNTKKPSWK